MKPQGRGARHRLLLACVLGGCAVGAATLPVAALEAPASYQIDPVTAQVAFDLKATLHTVRGSTSKVAGNVDAGPEADGFTPLSGTVVIDAASLDTKNPRRDRNMREKVLDVARFPEIRFAPGRLGPVGPDPADPSRTVREIHGDLTIRDVTKPVTLRGTVDAKSGRLVVDAGVEIAWGDFGCPDPSVLFLSVAKTLAVKLHVELVPR